MMDKSPSRRVEALLHNLYGMGKLPDLMNALQFVKDEHAGCKEAFNFLLPDNNVTVSAEVAKASRGGGVAPAAARPVERGFGKAMDKMSRYELMQLAGFHLDKWLDESALNMMKPYFSEQFVQSNWANMMDKSPSRRVEALVHNLYGMGKLPELMNALQFVKDEHAGCKEAFNFLTAR